LRISEIAFEIGFQSLTHFNRVFKRLAGQSPSEYRNQLPTPAQRPNLAARNPGKTSRS
jgi:AraC-like DNA-binding protein